MKWIRDLSGRFHHRPHYDLDDLDQECEGIVVAFLRRQYGSASYPISTNDLTILLEQETTNLDLYADLTAEGEGVEGVTDFFLNQKPSVRIARALSEQPWRTNRLRTTLTHELGHVKFHNALWTSESIQLSLFDARHSAPHPRCKRDSILGPDPVDWLEWQAGYACGAFLMPASAFRMVIGEFLAQTDLFGAVTVGTPASQELIRRVTTTFQVSADAARVRLLKLGFLTDRPQSRSLFAAEPLDSH